MKRVVKHFFIAVLLSFSMTLSAENDEQIDSLKVIHLEEVKIYSHKETMSQQMPILPIWTTITWCMNTQENVLYSKNFFTGTKTTWH
jgi:hypothetical protein